MSLPLRTFRTSASTRIARLPRALHTAVPARNLHAPVRPVLAPYKMASILQSTASAAHATFASLASASPIKAGSKVPDVDVRINDLEDKINFAKLQGKNVLVLVPGAVIGVIGVILNGSSSGEKDR
ncbi:hypothetical protein JCM24511_00077 [Saitozyma sp. JCM 24511]|nr:hypothetical protein JCM24511_00077 [Saitozyma sp. JCM 24511]